MLFHLHAENVLSNLPIRAKTHATYSSVYRLYISPALGKIPLCDIQRIDIARVISKLPPQTAAMTLAVMKSILREAVDHNLIELSPASGVRGPKITVPPRKFLTWDQLSDMDFDSYTTQIRFLALHGLRWSEALALEPVDFRNGRVHISKSIHGETKSPAAPDQFRRLVSLRIFLDRQRPCASVWILMELSYIPCDIRMPIYSKVRECM